MRKAAAIGEFNAQPGSLPAIIDFGFGIGPSESEVCLRNKAALLDSYSNKAA